MSTTSSISGRSDATANGHSSLQTPSKGMENDNVELNSIRGEQTLPSPQCDLMQLARLGDIVAIQGLYDEGKFDPKYVDEEGITPLHWAAINNRYALCRYLVELGANVNAKGGESIATPAMWAAQRCHYYVVNLLLAHGADPLLIDVQGYNMMHLATFDGNMFLLILLLHQNIPVDSTDPQGHTCLMWAAYKGYPACVDLFLRWGANVYATDQDGFTALHWALVKGSQGCTQKLLEYGSDRFAVSSTGKAPSTVAAEMNSMRVWQRALADCGYREDATPRSHIGASSIRNRSVLSKFYFLWPFFIVWCAMMILSHMVVYAAIPIAALVAYALQWLAIQLLKFAPPDMKHIHRTPFLAGVFAGISFWVGFRWCTTILPTTFRTGFFANLFFGTCYLLANYFYYTCFVHDPGFVPKLAGMSQQKTTIDELLSLWRFDAENYCVICMVRKPLRSKHCKKCGRCVAKHDHHCPWINNCVGVNNHRHFLFFLLGLESAVLTLVRLTINYLDVLPQPPHADCNILSGSLCQTYSKDPYTIVLVAFASLQLIWVTMLIFVQLVQIARAQTTFENMRGNIHHTPHGIPEAVTAAVTAGATSLEGAQLTPGGLGPDPALADSSAPHDPRHQGFLSQWKRLLGIDTFFATAQSGLGGSPARRPRNPFSRGLITNCGDFWCDGAPVFGTRSTGAATIGRMAVDYTKLYELPPRRGHPGMVAPSSGDDGYQSVPGEDVV